MVCVYCGSTNNLKIVEESRPKESNTTTGATSTGIYRAKVVCKDCRRDILGLKE